MVGKFGRPIFDRLARRWATALPVQDSAKITLPDADAGLQVKLHGIPGWNLVDIETVCTRANFTHVTNPYRHSEASGLLRLPRAEFKLKSSWALTAPKSTTRSPCQASGWTVISSSRPLIF